MAFQESQLSQVTTLFPLAFLFPFRLENVSVFLKKTGTAGTFWAQFRREIEGDGLAD